MTDLQFTNHGPFVACTPVTDVGEKWVLKNLQFGPPCSHGTVYVEHRYLADIVNGARADGLVCAD